jgi:hypothetical protein
VSSARPPAPAPDPLRAEHDALAERLAARRSIDLVRVGAYTAFAALVTSGLAMKLGSDRWLSTRVNRFQSPPVYFFVALLAAAALTVVAGVCFARARRLMRTESADFERLCALRTRLELDP